MIVRHTLYLALLVLSFCKINGQDSASIHVIVDSIGIYASELSSNKSINHDVYGNTVSTLDQKSSLTIRRNNPGGLSTIINRGLASRHTGIIWNGFNILNTVNGTFDINLVPQSFFKLSLLDPLQSPSLGNASAGGSLLLGERKGGLFTAGITYGNDQNLGISISSTLSSNKASLNINLELLRNNNAYYFDRFGDKTRQRFAAFDSENISLNGRYLITDHWSVSSAIWYQNADRTISPSKTTTQVGNQFQKDQNLRINFSSFYALDNEKGIRLRTAFFDEYLEFVAPGIFSTSDVDVYNAALEFVGYDHLFVSLQHRTDVVDANFYNEQQARNVTSAVLRSKNTINGYNTIVSWRPQLVDGELFADMYSIGIQKDYSVFSSDLSYSTAYTFPSLNDFYWPQGGNPNLLNEQASTLSLKLYQEKQSKWIDKWSVDLYHVITNNWIQWIPIEGLFQPINQKKIRNIGIDIEAKKSWNLKNGRLIVALNYGFVDSRIRDHFTDLSRIGTRNIFVPNHKLASTISYQKDTWSVLLNNIVYGNRFDTFDNSTQLPAYAVFDLSINKTFTVLQGEWKASFAIENILNTTYEHVRFFPMPLRLFRIGLNYRLNKN